MAVSVGMLGILLMLDIFFIMNFFIVRALRHWTNKTVKQQKEALASRGGFISGISDVCFAWLVGSVRLEPMSVRKFPDYKSIPYSLGLLSTSVFIVISSILLAPNLIPEQLGITGLSLNTEFCVNERFDAGLAELKKELYQQTNFREARKQHKAMTHLRDLLLNDTALYGVEPFQCPSHRGPKGKKHEWNKEHDFRVPFFPNYCQEALESALQAAQDRECSKEICKCPTLPDNPAFHMIGLADQVLCEAEVCFSIPVVCPPHENDGFNSSALVEDYRYQQLLAAEKRRTNISLAERAETGAKRVQNTIPEELQTTAAQTADKILYQVDIASYIYIAYSCLAMFFPSPLILFRMPYLLGWRRFFFGVQKPYFIAMVVAMWWGVEYFHAVWYSPDLQLFLNNIKVGDPCFVDPDYLMERQGILGDTCEALLPLKDTFTSAKWTVIDVWREVKFFHESCQCPFPNLYTPQFNPGDTVELGFNATLELCREAEDCTTLYGMPNENTTYLGNASICRNGTEARRMIWESHADETHSQTPDMWADLWIASGFLATLLIKVAVANFGISLMEVADPFVVCAGEFLWMPTSFGSANTLETFDSDGRPLPNEMVQTWFKAKKHSLKHVGISKALFWGAVVHLCMLNLLLSVYQENYSDLDFAEIDLHSLYQRTNQKDLTVLGVCLGISALVIVGGVYIVCRLYRSASAVVIEQDQATDKEGSSDDELTRFRSKIDCHQASKDMNMPSIGSDGPSEGPGSVSTKKNMSSLILPQ